MRKPMVVRSCTAGMVALLMSSALTAQDEGARPSQIVEIRSYNLKPGTRDRFHQLFEREALPMLQRFKIDVVAYGPSLHGSDSYYLMRSYSSVESYATVVVRLDDATLRGLRRTPIVKEDAMQSDAAPTSDLTTLLELNRDYIRSVQTSDVQRFEEILAEDFLCSLPDGSLIDRERFLEQTALPVKVSNLEAHDVNVRLMGNFAIIHARTTYTTPDGRPGSGRYTDVWARRHGRWLAVSAHVTRS